jgi:lipopolysaccharide/colanic/teichoic acid biosynthesis glycosyltransferase
MTETEMNHDAMRPKPPSSDIAIGRPVSATANVNLAAVAKRLLDIVVATVALIIMAPVFGVIAILLKTRYRNVPVFYGGWVIGQNGTPFRMWKFSTMRADAHLVLKKMLEENPALRAEWDQNVKLQKDPRILPGIGSFLRRSSLNELPQFYNVLIGDMSLVGPRPITQDEEKRYMYIGGMDMLASRNAQRPGITGLWQATGRSDVTYEERVKIDQTYLREQCFSLDLKILWWTLRKVVSGEGAV